MKIKTLALALAVSTAMTGAANAASFTKTYEVKLVFASNAPNLSNATVNQTFNVTFDPAKNDKPIVNYFSDTAGVYGNRLNDISGNDNYGKLYFSFAYVNEKDFGFRTGFTTDMTGGNPVMNYTEYKKGTSSYYYPVSTSISIKLPAAANDPTVPAVPEPASWMMMLVGFGLIGATARYRRRSATVRYA